MNDKFIILIKIKLLFNESILKTKGIYLSYQIQLLYICDLKNFFF